MRLTHNNLLSEFTSANRLQSVTLDKVPRGSICPLHSLRRFVVLLLISNIISFLPVGRIAGGTVLLQTVSNSWPNGLYDKNVERAVETNDMHLRTPIGVMASVKNTRVTTLKSFLASPPEQIEAVYERVILRGQKKTEIHLADASDLVVRKKKKDLFLIRWCSMGFMRVNSEDATLAEDPRSVSATNFITSSGGYSNRIWSLEPAVQGVVKVSSTNYQRVLKPAQLVYFSPVETNNASITFYQKKVLRDEQAVREIIHFGIRNCRPHSLHWDGDRFKALTAVGETILGSLEIVSEIPVELRYSIGQVSYSVKLLYHDNEREVLPSSFLVRQTQPVPLPQVDDAQEIHFRSFEAKTQTQPAFFQPTALLRGVRFSSFIESNGVMRNLQSGAVVGTEVPPLHSRSRKFITVAVLLLFIIPPLLFAIHHFKKRGAPPS